MSEQKDEYIELLDLALEEDNLQEIIEIAQRCGALEPGLEKRVKEAVRKHKERLVDHLNNLWSKERKNCRAGLAFSYGVLGLIENFEEVYGLKEEVKIGFRKSISLGRIKRGNFKNPPERLVGLGLVPRKLTAEHDGSFADDYRLKVQRELVPEIENLGLGEEQVDYVFRKTNTLLQALPLLRYQ